MSNPDVIVGSQDLTNYQLQSKFCAGAASNIPFPRAPYWLDDIASRGLVDINRCWFDLTRRNIEKNEFSNLLIRISKECDRWPAIELVVDPDNPHVKRARQPAPDYNRAIGLQQGWKLAAQIAPRTPSLWRDSFTGEVLQNPLMSDPPDLAGLGVLLVQDPDLAKAFKLRSEKSPYEIAGDERLMEAARQTLLKLDYNAREHASNPHKPGDQFDPDLQGTLRQIHGDLVADIWTAEARMPIRLPWQYASSDRLNRDLNGKLMASFDAVPYLGVNGDLFRRAAIMDQRLAEALRKDATNRAARAAAEANRLAQAARR